MPKPLLSIGIIFKNEIRCIERCLQSLQPLRDAIPCELVMADTGSDDGSRAIAEKYADILIDFPWINDFAAARNAVLDRCTGKWLFSVDCDEYLDPDIKQLVDFVRIGARRQDEAGLVIQRNYATVEMDENFSDFQAGRLLRRSTGARWHGSIHELWRKKDLQPLSWAKLLKTILHHDGYVAFGEESGRTKRERNIQLLRQELDQNPDDLRRLMQFIESGEGQPDLIEKVRHAVAMVRGKKTGWQRRGPSILRYGVELASREHLPELEEWELLAEEWFPDSYFTRIDVTFRKFLDAWRTKKKYTECIQLGERYLKAYADLQEDPSNKDITVSVISHAQPVTQRKVQVLLFASYVAENRLEQALSLIENVDFSQLGPEGVTIVLQNMLNLHFKSELDTSQFITDFWEKINAPVPNIEQAQKRRDVVLRAAGNTFLPKIQNASRKDPQFRRDAYTLFLPLGENCEAARAAAVMAEKNPAVLEEKLRSVERWDEFPIYALSHALEQGIDFPLPEKPLNMEEMDNLAIRLAEDHDTIFKLACGAVQADFSANWQDLLWTRGLVIAAVQVFDWINGEAVLGLTLIRAFISVEKVYLPLCYSSEVLQENQLCALPSVHRFGWFCVHAFAAFDAGDTIGFVRLLREGLKASPNMKELVEFLTNSMPQLSAPSGELTELAEQVRLLLLAYPADDPSVTALKNSSVYQKVVHLIE